MLVRHTAPFAYTTGIQAWSRTTRPGCLLRDVRVYQAVAAAYSTRYYASPKEDAAGSVEAKGGS
jgi:hypothetical protein